MNNRTPAKILGHLLGISAILGAIACGQILGIEETTLQEASCTDGTQNGDETDKDCGGSCSQKCSPQQACKEAKDCASNVCENGLCVGLGPQWACLASITPPKGSLPSIEIKAKTTDTKNTPIESVSVKACSLEDITCNSPAAEILSDATGNAPLVVPTGGFGGGDGTFKGYLLFEAPDYQPLIWFFPVPLVANIDSLPAFLSKKTEWESLASSFVSDTSGRATRGDFVAQFVDCGGKPAQGLIYDIPSRDAASSKTLFSFPFSDGLPATDASGYAAMFNLPSGSATISVRDEKTKLEVGPPYSFFFRGGYSSTFVLPPH